MEVADFIQRMAPRLFADYDGMLFYIELSTSMTSSSYFGTFYNYAIALRAMHNWIIDSGRPLGEAGVVTSKAEGNARISYWNKVEKGRYSDLYLTHYGQRLLALIKARTGAISVSNDDANLLSGTFPAIPEE
jgi:hypothetical protein